MTTMKSDDLSKVVEQAETAVAGMKDPVLRRAAFEKVLDRLLGSGEPAARSGARAAKRTPSQRVRGGPQAHVEEIIDAGFFKKPQQFKAIMGELEARGHHLPRTTLSPTLLALCRAKRLRRRKVEGSWEYSNW